LAERVTSTARLLRHPVRANARFRMLDTLSNSGTPDKALARLRRGLLQWPLALAVAALVLLSLIFLLAPNLDVAISGLFYEQSTATLAIGPGLIVNGIMKEHWGRARPRTILEFGGDAAYSPVWWISDQCDRNCSFVSGEAASAFWLVTIAFLVRKELSPAVAAITFVFAAAVSFTRIAVGAHFLSDVVIAWLITFCVILVAHRLIMEQLPLAFDRAVENAAGRSGEALRRLVAGGASSTRS
jgi:lipid A 4'-phosphatase